MLIKVVQPRRHARYVHHQERLCRPI